MYYQSFLSICIFCCVIVSLPVYFPFKNPIWKSHKNILWRVGWLSISSSVNVKLCTMIKCLSEMLVHKRRHTNTQGYYYYSTHSHVVWWMKLKVVTYNLVRLVSENILCKKKCLKKKHPLQRWPCRLVYLRVCICVCVVMNCAVTNQPAPLHSCRQNRVLEPKQNFSLRTDTHTRTQSNNTSVRSLFFHCSVTGSRQ